MRLNSFQRLLGFLALFGAVHGSISPANSECTTHAWVRAEDLTPSTVVRGSARVKISTGCPPVESVLLGLRLKERSFMKALLSQEDRKRMPVKSVHPLASRSPFQTKSPWAFPLSRFDNHADEAVFYEMLANKDAWIIREEERIVFETTQPIPIVEGASLDHDVVHHFAVLVPSTNFPPAQDYINSGFMPGGSGPVDTEIVDVESMNEYFIRVSFVNGTTEDISAGFTGFQPLYDPTDSRRLPIPEKIALEPMEHHDHSPATNYTVQISSASDLIFTEGFRYQLVTMTMTRTGPARTFSAPLTVRGCIQPNFSSKWAAEYGMSVSRPWHVPGYVLRSTLEDVDEAKYSSWKSPCSSFTEVSVMVPDSTAEVIESHDIVTTTSTPFSIPVKVDRRHITNFDAYYQTLTNSLLITLTTPRIQGEEVDPDDPSATKPKPKPRAPRGPLFEDDEEEWVPWMMRKMPQMPQPMALHSYYSGTVPVVVRPLGDVTPSLGCLHPSTDRMNQDILSDKPGGCERPLLTHYLDKGARGPIFVDRSTVPEVLAEDPAERELRAPILQPVVSSPPEGEELIYRYDSQFNPERPPIYVGETWARKVAGKGED